MSDWLGQAQVSTHQTVVISSKMEAEEMVIRLPGRCSAPGGNREMTVLRHKEVHHFFFLPFREQPIYSTRAHVFQIDPNTKKNWMPTSKHAVTVSYFYDSTRNVYRIISLDGSKVMWCFIFIHVYTLKYKVCSFMKNL